jgi:hypothetical protein
MTTDLELRNPDDFYSSDCPDCGNAVEFYADDVLQNCVDCGSLQHNPRMIDEWEQKAALAV